MREWRPTASSREYPVTISNAGFTYSIVPLRSVMMTTSADCSTARARDSRISADAPDEEWRSVCFDSFIAIHSIVSSGKVLVLNRGNWGIPEWKEKVFCH